MTEIFVYLLKLYLIATLYLMSQPRQSLLNAASRVGEASHRVLTTIGDEDEETREMQDTLLGK